MDKNPFIFANTASFEEMVARKRQKHSNMGLIRLSFLIISLTLLALYLGTPLFGIIS